MSKKKKDLLVEHIVTYPLNPPSPATEIVDKTGCAGIEYARIPPGRAFRIENINGIYVMINFLDADTNTVGCVDIQTGVLKFYTTNPRCYLLELKIYVTKTLSE